MKIQLQHIGTNYECDLSQPIDISIPVGEVRCFYSTEYKATPYTSGDFVGSVKEGAPVNFYDVVLNPHGNGTHTECLGHITLAQESINDHLKEFHFVAQVVSVPVTTRGEDQVLTEEALRTVCLAALPEAIVIRTIPNEDTKLTEDYSGTNPPYMDIDAMKFLVASGVKHVLLDLPSVDREVDAGKLVCHHHFWNVENRAAKDDSRADCTITEMIFVPEEVEDGLYFLNIQIPSLPLDAAPSKPVLYRMKIKM